ncbi:hypothetical protein ACFZB5_20250 [Streptomyces nodosus]|uniref:hypothetical protein n=1 Tax=Streptomyces nodosus TaxID=40318 RepID=UPI0036E9F454
MSRTVAEVKGAPHDEVMERLRLVAAHHRPILSAEPPRWARLDASDCYRFEHGPCGARCTTSRPLSRAIPARPHLHSPHIRPAGEPAAGRRLEIARRLRSGGSECLFASVEVYYGLARDAAMEGLSFAEAERHCEEVIRAVRDLPEQEEGRDRGLVQAVELLLSLTEVRWRGQHHPARGPDIEALAAEAEAAATRLGTPALAIRTTLLRGKTLLATQGLVPSLDKLRVADEPAEEHGDSVRSSSPASNTDDRSPSGGWHEPSAPASFDLAQSPVVHSSPAMAFLMPYLRHG